MTAIAEWAERTLEDLPTSVRGRLMNGEIVLVPVTGAYVNTWRRIADQIEKRASGWEPIGWFRVLPKLSGYSPEPDLSAVRDDAFDPATSGYEQSALPFVAEIVSPTTERCEFRDRSVEYAARGIPVFLVIDVFNARWVLMSKLADFGDGPEYAAVENGVFGEPIEIKTDDFAVTLDSSEFEAIRKRPTA